MIRHVGVSLPQSVPALAHAVCPSAGVRLLVTTIGRV
jgi:hypothetical protein